MKKMLAVAFMVGAAFPAATLAGSTSEAPLMIAQAAQGETANPKVVRGGVVTLRGTVDAVDLEKKTVTLKGPKGNTLTLQVKDPKKLEMIKVGDPVVAKYYEALAIELKKPGEATPSVSVEKAAATSKSGDTPAAMVGEQVTATVTVVGIDTKAQTVTVKGPEGKTETVKARDPKNLAKLKVGDMLDVTYTRALAISLDKPAAK